MREEADLIQMTIVSTTVDKNPLEGMVVALRVNQGIRNAVLGCNLKDDRMISACLEGRPFNITVIQVYTPTTTAKEDEVEWFYKDLQDLLELTAKWISFWSWETGMQK